MRAKNQYKILKLTRKERRLTAWHFRALILCLTMDAPAMCLSNAFRKTARMESAEGSDRLSFVTSTLIAALRCSVLKQQPGRGRAHAQS